MEKIINPAKLSQEDATLLKALFDQSKHTGAVFKRERPYTIHLANASGQGHHSVTIKLKNTIIKRKREKHTDQYRYDIMDDKHLLGEGGFSQVHNIKGTLKPNDHGLELSTRKPRVVKIQQHHYKTFDREVEELNREVNISEASEVMHVKRPAFFMDNEHNGFNSYTVMRKIAGRELFNIANDERELGVEAQLSTHMRLSLTLNALRSLKELHRRSIIHRDIKIENMFFDNSTRSVTYIDYGLSKFKGMKDTELCGTFGYIAPEVYQGKNSDEKSDLYSLGIALSIVWGAGQQDKFSGKHYEKPDFDGLFEDISTDLKPVEKLALSDWLKKITEPDETKRHDVETAIAELKRICRHYIQHHRSRQGSYHNISQSMFHQESKKTEEPKTEAHVHFMRA